MARLETLIRAAHLARAASDSLTIASCGVTSERRQTLKIEAEAALYEAIDLIWQSARIVPFASPANGDGDDFTPTDPAAGAAVPQMERAA